MSFTQVIFKFIHWTIFFVVTYWQVFRQVGVFPFLSLSITFNILLGHLYTKQYTYMSSY
jgi:hypothetical protein